MYRFSGHSQTKFSGEITFPEERDNRMKWIRYEKKTEMESIANLLRNRFVSDLVILVEDRESDKRRSRSSGEERSQSHSQHVPHLLLPPFSSLEISPILAKYT